jgi:hypothetical protein
MLRLLGSQDLHPCLRIVCKRLVPTVSPLLMVQIVACHGQHRVEALLQLPVASVASKTSDCPEGLWLTVGILATDGMTLQLKLTRNDQVGENACPLLEGHSSTDNLCRHP